MLWDMPRRIEDLPEEYWAYKDALGVAIGERIRARRRELGLTQDMVRARMELENVYVSSGHFSRYETGEYLPSAIAIIGLVKVLQVSCSWLLFGDDPSPPDKS